MECFFLVATYGTISESTKHTFYSSSTISMQINSFEYDLQIKLFDKTNKKWILTKKGEQIYKLVNNIMTTFKQLYDTKKLKLKPYLTKIIKKIKLIKWKVFARLLNTDPLRMPKNLGLAKQHFQSK